MNILSLIITNSSHIAFFVVSFSIVILPVHIHGFLMDYTVIKVKSNLVIQTPKSQNKELAVIWSTQRCQDVMLFLTISTWPLPEAHVSASEFWANNYTLQWVARSRHSDGGNHTRRGQKKNEGGKTRVSCFFFISCQFFSCTHNLNTWNRLCCGLVNVHLYENYMWFFRVMLSCHSYPFLFPLYGSPSIFMEQQKLKFCFSFLKKKERWALNKF